MQGFKGFWETPGLHGDCGGATATASYTGVGRTRGLGCSVMEFRNLGPLTPNPCMPLTKGLGFGGLGGTQFLFGMTLKAS